MKKCCGLIENGWCKSCGKSEGAAQEVCFYDDHFWVNLKADSDLWVNGKHENTFGVSPVFIDKPKKKRKKSLNDVFKPGRYYDHKGVPVPEPEKLPRKNKPITIDNFFVVSSGIWHEIEAMPDGFTSFFKSKGSEYFKNESEDVIVRVSDHWGSNIRNCNWYLKMIGEDKHLKINCGTFSRRFEKKKFMGIVNVSKLN